MGYKQTPFPMQKGTSGHASALKSVSPLKVVMPGEEEMNVGAVTEDAVTEGVEQGMEGKNGDDKKKHDNWMFGQETGVIKKDEFGYYVVLGEGDDMYRGVDENYDQKIYRPQEFAAELTMEGELTEGDYIDDRDIAYEKVDGRWTIVDIDIHEEEKDER